MDGSSGMLMDGSVEGGLEGRMRRGGGRGFVRFEKYSGLGVLSVVCDVWYFVMVVVCLGSSSRKGFVREGGVVCDRIGIG